MPLSNLELQAILDAPDSDSSSQEDAMMSSIIKSSKRSADSDINLERILREHDDDDDDDDLGYNFDLPHGVRNHLADDHYSVGCSTISTRPNLFPQTPPATQISRRMNGHHGQDGGLMDELGKGQGSDYHITPTVSPFFITPPSPCLSLAKVFSLENPSEARKILGVYCLDPCLELVQTSSGQHNRTTLSYIPIIVMPIYFFKKFYFIITPIVYV